MTAVISLDHATRRYGDVVALDDVSLEVPAGELVGLLGPNGAGKSTLLNLVNGLRPTTSGTVRIFGADPRVPASRIQLGTTPQETGLPPTLRVGEVVDFVGGHYPDPMSRDELLSRFGLADLAQRQTGGLSGGQKRRLAVALSIVGRPRLVLLDEPTTGLDVEARRLLWDAVREYHADGATIVVTSHYLEEIEALAQRVVVIGHGHVLADDDLATIVGRVSARHVRLRLAGDARAVVDALPGVVDATADGDRWTILTTDSDAVIRALVTQGVTFSGLEVRGASLEEAFLAMTASDDDGDASSGAHVAPSSSPSDQTQGALR
ncbi:ABC transporter related [Beutenbergia cavernae DSM 12333]|uniref:ABC transporter related n=1 Tax=Beutenbergia cavernae (strain ATCC BAA-8 / DSM 12333 / CCUG 43141 / JCM 11478 / NBRC 16432 / NCIMB 13614 / HKI 0122) TaxID=471853 RepID=C5C5C6_BEUC1|nr:ABC transporter ATP-binding protein [Beutenbergia cavernae]ACQ82266.1 ABC transporter related [Beutenbergia cavernae DSM 12333]